MKRVSTLKAPRAKVYVLKSSDGDSGFNITQSKRGSIVAEEWGDASDEVLPFNADPSQVVPLSRPPESKEGTCEDETDEQRHILDKLDPLRQKKVALREAQELLGELNRNTRMDPHKRLREIKKLTDLVETLNNEISSHFQSERRSTEAMIADGLKKRSEGKRCTLDPRSAFMGRWDPFMVLLLAFTALVTPFEVAFLESNFSSGLYYINRVVDFGFVCDMFMNFFMVFHDETLGVWVYTPKRIICRYLSGWFFLDLISIFPFDSIGIYVKGNAEATNAEATALANTNGTGDVVPAYPEQLKLLRIVRLLRLVKLLRVIRSMRILQRLEASGRISYSKLDLSKVVVAFLIVLHWSACLWNLPPAYANETTVTWWDIPIIERGEKEHGAAAGEQVIFPRDMHPGDLWLLCMEFALQAMVQGYGGVMPATTSERAVALFIMMVGMLVYSWFLGNFCATITNSDPATTLFKQNMDMLNQYMEEIALPKELRHRLREYFTRCREIQRKKYYLQLYDDMSSTLAGEVALIQNSEWIKNVPFFTGPLVDPREADIFAAEISFVIRPQAYAPEELIIREGERSTSMYIITKGLVGHKGFCLRAGRFFGEDMIASLLLREAISDHRAQCLTYVNASVLEKDKIFEIIETGRFPQVRKRVRREALRFALQKVILKITRLHLMRTATRGTIRMTEAEIEEWKLKMSKRGQESKDVYNLTKSSGKGGNTLTEGVIGIGSTGTCLTMAEEDGEVKKVDSRKKGLDADTLKYLEEASGGPPTVTVVDLVGHIKILEGKLETQETNNQRVQDQFTSIKKMISLGMDGIKKEIKDTMVIQQMSQ